MLNPMNTQAIIQILSPVLDLFDQLGIPYRVGGSVATSFYGPQRARLVALVPGTRLVWISTAEDMLLEKLLWWRLGGGVSTRQWNDIVGLIQHHASQFDTSYLDASARSLAILPLLQQAYTDAGVAFP